MNKPIAIISSICQAAFFIAFAFAVVDMYEFLSQFGPDVDPDPRQIKPIMDTKLFNMLVLLIGGLLGVVLSWFALRKLDERPRWFLNLTAIFASIWLLVFPVGTVAGLLIFRWRRPLAKSHETT